MFFSWDLHKLYSVWKEYFCLKMYETLNWNELPHHLKRKHAIKKRNTFSSNCIMICISWIKKGFTILLKSVILVLVLCYSELIFFVCCLLCIGTSDFLERSNIIANDKNDVFEQQVRIMACTTSCVCFFFCSTFFSGMLFVCVFESLVLLLKMQAQLSLGKKKSISHTLCTALNHSFQFESVVPWIWFNHSQCA